MQFTNHTNATFTHVNRGRTTRVESGNLFAHKTCMKWCHQTFHITLHVKEVNATGRFAPLRIVHITVSQARNTLRLVDPLHRPRTIIDGRIWQEDAAQFKNAHAFGLAVQVVLENVDQTADHLCSHHRQLRDDRVQQSNRVLVTREVLFPDFWHEGEVDQFLITQARHFTTQIVTRARIFASSLHRDTSKGRTIRQLFVAIKTSHFFDQIFFNFNVKTIARRLHREDFTIKAVFKA